MAKWGQRGEGVVTLELGDPAAGWRWALVPPSEKRKRRELRRER